MNLITTRVGAVNVRAIVDYVDLVAHHNRRLGVQLVVTFGCLVRAAVAMVPLVVAALPCIR